MDVSDCVTFWLHSLPGDQLPKKKIINLCYRYMNTASHVAYDAINVAQGEILDREQFKNFVLAFNDFQEQRGE